MCWGNLYPEISHVTGVQDHLERLNFKEASSNISSSSMPVITESENLTAPHRIWEPPGLTGAADTPSLHLHECVCFDALSP